eukprot:3243993-Rhodomonas_salina.1
MKTHQWYQSTPFAQKPVLLLVPIYPILPQTRYLSSTNLPDSDTNPVRFYPILPQTRYQSTRFCHRPVVLALRKRRKLPPLAPHRRLTPLPQSRTLCTPLPRIDLSQ